MPQEATRPRKRTFALTGSVALLAALTVAGCGTAKEGTATATAPQSGTTAAATTEAPAAAAEAAVKESGFSQDGENVTYGAVIENTSTDSEAVGVEVAVNALDVDGNVLGTSTASISVIPPDSVFNIGGEGLSVAASDKVAKLDVAVTTESSGDPEHPLPKVSNVRMSRDVLGLVVVRAQVENNLEGPLSSITDVMAVLRNGAGKIVGGASGFPESDIPAGQKRGVEIQSVFVDLKSAKTADVSVDNET